MSRATVTSKGQVTIPKDVRDRLHLRPGVRLDFSVNEEGCLVGKPLTKSVEEVFGMLHRYAFDRPVPAEELDDGIADHLREKHGTRGS